jgi:hypothetical protein
LNSQLISTIDHLREEKAFFTAEFFQDQKIPPVLAKILSQEIQRLGQSQGSQQSQGAQDANKSQNNPYYQQAFDGGGRPPNFSGQGMYPSGSSGADPSASGIAKNARSAGQGGDPIKPVKTTQPKASVAPPPVSPVLNSPHHLSLSLSGRRRFLNTETGGHSCGLFPFL